MAVGLRPRGGRAGGEADGGQIQTWALLLMGESWVSGSSCSRGAPPNDRLRGQGEGAGASSLVTALYRHEGPRLPDRFCDKLVGTLRANHLFTSCAPSVFCMGKKDHAALFQPVDIHEARRTTVTSGDPHAT